MKPLIPLIIMLSLTIGSCSTPQGKTITNIERTEPAATLTSLPPDTLTPAPDPTQTTPVTATLIPVSASGARPAIEEIVFLPPLTAGQPVTITQITMIDAANGWAIGHQKESGDRVLFTGDGGNDWVDRSPPISAISQQNGETLSAWGYFLDAYTAWAVFIPQGAPPPVKAPVVWRTSDGGITWEASDPLPITGAESYFIPENFSFINALQGWLLVHIDAGMNHDYSNLFATNDGGFTWQRLIDPYREGLQSLHNTGLAFADATFGWVTKDNLAVMPGVFLEQTHDGGLSWENIYLPASAEFDWINQVSQCASAAPLFPESETGMVLINCHTFEEQTFTYTYRTTDRGDTWQSVQLPTPAQSLVFINAQIGWALGRDIYQSVDGGLSWAKIKSVNWDGQFSFVDAQTGWAVARAAEAIALVYTQDGGNTWQQINPTIR